MKKNNNYPETLVYDTRQQVLKAVVPATQDTKKKDAVVSVKEKSKYITRRYSFDDNGGGYAGL